MLGLHISMNIKILLSCYQIICSALLSQIPPVPVCIFLFKTLLMRPALVRRAAGIHKPAAPDKDTTSGVEFKRYIQYIDISSFLFF